jgi:hypothetical protein
MAPPIPRTSIELDYPLYSVDFDKNDAKRIVVGGGGGANRSGVGNKISVLEASSETELRLVTELDFSRDEDSVMSLALGPLKGKITSLYAGINSSPASIESGKNEHLRTVALETPKGGVASPNAKTKQPVATKLTEVSRSSLFQHPDKETYQRLLRISGGMGVAATAMGKESQLAVFEAGSAAPKLRGILELARDAEDVDIIQTGEKEYQIAFCYKYELHVINIGKETSDPELIYTMPEENDERPAFRCIRYLTPSFILAVANLPKRSGVIIQGLRLPTPGHEKARVAATTRIPRAISTTAMDVTNLSPPPSPGASITDTQFLIAVAGHDSSISLYTLEQVTTGQVTLLVNLYPLTTFKDAHDGGSITGLAFSTFIAPKNNLRPSYVKLASISLQKSVAVHYIALKKFVDNKPRNKKGPPREPRYVVAMKSKAPSNTPLIATLSVMALIMAIVFQGLMELYGNSRPVLHVHKYLPGWHGTLRTPEHPPAFFAENEFLAKLVGEGQTTSSGETIVIRDTPQTADGDDQAPAQDLHVGIHEGEGSPEDTKEWHELPKEQKEAWKARLSDAGTWTREMGEGVFKGILFGQLAEVVGQAVAG